MRLPDDFLVRRLAEHWAVVGPTGLFVVGRADVDPAGAARRTAAAAMDLRNRLAEVVPWVPFVSPIVIGDAERSDLECTMVPVRRLEAVLTEGPVAIDDQGLHQLRIHLPGVVQTMDLERAGHPG